MQWLITIIWVVHVQKNFKITTVIKQFKQLLAESIFNEIAQNFKTHKSRSFKSIIGTF